MVTQVNYVDYSIFGQRPSTNANFNILVCDSEIPHTPFFQEGRYSNYYCMIGEGQLYPGKPIFNGGKT